tara:strand:+ start:632 stop:946 length:315 start_codon:yes stop_codon:yes gene_type:complete
MQTLNALFNDTLWIYTAIAGALIGAAFLAWFKGTRAGLWCYSIFDRTLDFLVDRWGWTWLQEPEDAWRKKYPKITKKVDDLELRLKVLESNKGNKIIRQKKEKK